MNSGWSKKKNRKDFRIQHGSDWWDYLNLRALLACLHAPANNKHIFLFCVWYDLTVNSPINAQEV